MDYRYLPHHRTFAHVSPAEASPEVPTRASVTRQLGFNSRLGVWITRRVGSMWCAYIFAGLALVSLPTVLATGSLVLIVAWCAQTFLQLVLLSIIMVGQNVSGAASDARAESTFRDTEAILHEAVESQRHLHAQDADMREVLGRLRGTIVGVAPSAPDPSSSSEAQDDATNAGDGDS